MKPVQCVFYQELKQYVYESNEQREIHVEKMNEEGWRVGDQVRRLKGEASLYSANDDDFEWFAEFRKNIEIDESEGENL